MPAGDADLIRDYLCKQVEEARCEGKTQINFRAGDVHSALKLCRAHPNVCQVLDGEKFRTRAGVKPVKYVGPSSRQGVNSRFYFEIIAP